MNQFYEYVHKQVTREQFPLIMHRAKELNQYGDKFISRTRFVDGYCYRVRFTSHTLHIEVFRNEASSTDRFIIQITDVDNYMYDQKRQDLHFYGRGVHWAGNKELTNMVSYDSDSDLISDSQMVYPPDEASYFQRSVVEEVPEIEHMDWWYNMMSNAPPATSVYCVGFMVPDLYNLSLHNIFEDTVRLLNDFSEECSGVRRYDYFEVEQRSIF